MTSHFVEMPFHIGTVCCNEMESECPSDLHSMSSDRLYKSWGRVARPVGQKEYTNTYLKMMNNIENREENKEKQWLGM